MFWQIFLFEIRYRLKRPDAYLYFFIFFITSTLSFANGAVPANDQTFVNAPVVLAKYFSIFSLFMMVVTAAIMGSPLYRDLEYNTHEYYLSYPITKNGYFWGRFLGSFLFVSIIGSALVWGSMLGIFLGPKLGWIPAGRVDHTGVMTYMKPFLEFVLPNLLLTSVIFFGLVAHTRNNKVIYTGGVLLYLGYVLSVFTIHSLSNQNMAYYLDAFGFAPISIQTAYYSPEQLNHVKLPLTGLLLVNRVIWTAVSLLIIFLTWYRFNFIRFFAGGRSRRKNRPEQTEKLPAASTIPALVSDFSGNYYQQVMKTLVKIEWLSIVRDNYFRLILASGTLFLCFLFCVGGGRQYNVTNLPRTTILMDIYNENFILFTFLILMFYTGEIVHRERSTRFALINDALPAPDSVLYSSKLLALFLLALLLATVPMLAGIGVQLAKGFTRLNLPAYLISCFGLSLPMFVEITMFCFTIHVLVNNKFAGHAVALMIWILIFAGHTTGRFDYRLLLYSYTPDYWLTDMDGLGPSAAPQIWFNLYWLLAGGILVILAALFYYRGVLSGFGERTRLAIHRYRGNLRIVSFVLIILFLGAGAYNYYNVSYLNQWRTHSESDGRQAIYEKSLKRYQGLPLPGVTRMRVFCNLFPEDRRVSTVAFLTLVNNSEKPITEMLLDADALSAYSIRENGQAMHYLQPLSYPWPLFTFFKKGRDTSMFRLYQFSGPLRPGDTTELEIRTELSNDGFTNDFSGLPVQHNGSALTSYLPELGYDPGDELRDNIIRKSYGLPPKEEDKLAPPGDSEGIRNIGFSPIPNLIDFEATVSTSAGQLGIAPGKPDSNWVSGGRRYFHYHFRNPETYFLFPVLSARYSVFTDSVSLEDGSKKCIELDYHQPHDKNLSHFKDALKDGLPYFSKAFGDYPFSRIRIAEGPAFVGTASAPTSVLFGENYAWNADFHSPNQFDYVYFFTSFQLAKQWWTFQVAPNHTEGSRVISDGLSKYAACLLYRHQFGGDQLKVILREEAWWYTLMHGFRFREENPLLTANRDFIWSRKAGLIFYGLMDLIGEDSLNTALKQFHDAFAFQSRPPYAGADDLYKILKARVPDSLQYYLADSWEKITFYDNQMLKASARPLGKSTYTVHLEFKVRKLYTDKTGKETDATGMQDYIDIGIFGKDIDDKKGRSSPKILHLKRYRLSAGLHSLDIIVGEKPASAGIDPESKLIEKSPQDNNLNF